MGECMIERPMAGTLNSKSVYGQSYGNYECFRSSKLNKIFNLSRSFNPLIRNWYKKHRMPRLRFAPSLWNYGGEIQWTQRHFNMNRKKKRIELFPWRASK